MSGSILALAIANPKSAEAREKLLKLDATGVYRDPSVDASASLYLDPLKLKIPYPAMFEESEVKPIVAISVLKSAESLAAITKTAEFKNLASKIESEGLYAKSEDVSSYNPVAGYLGRGGPSRKSNAHYLFKMKAKAGREDQFVGLMKGFSKWVYENEPTTLTYCLWKNTDGSDYIMWERYAEQSDMDEHVKTEPFLEFFKKSPENMDETSFTVAQFDELEGSFVTGAFTVF